MVTTDQIDLIRTRYFSDPKQQMQLAEGEQLLYPGQDNHRLFLVLEGQLTGYLDDHDGGRFALFTAGPDNLAGVYSFFSPGHQSYSTVIATQPTVLAVLDEAQVNHPNFDYPTFAAMLLPAVVNEIYIRQLLMYRMHHDRQQALRRLAQAEKMASLGQMAAGLAHELNNAVGVIRRNADTLAERLRANLRILGAGQWLPWFERGLQEGQNLSTEVIRQRRQELEQTLGVSQRTAKKLAKAGLTAPELQHWSGRQLDEQAEAIIEQFEAGVGLHDLMLAARHAENVVRSVRELGAQYRREPQPTDLNQTLREALALLKNRLKTNEVQLDLAPLPTIPANASDWLQVWINLLKNAADALDGAHTTRPRIRVHSSCTNKHITVRITDNGPGIPPEIMDQIFQPHVTTKRDGLSFGLGLGLTVVERIVQSYQGHIAVQSRPGETIFTLTIPLAATAEGNSQPAT